MKDLPCVEGMVLILSCSSLCLCMKTAQPCIPCSPSLHQTQDSPTLGSLVLRSECVFTSRPLIMSLPSSYASVYTGVCRCDLLGMCMCVKLTLGVIFYHFSPHFLRLFWSLPFGLDWLTSKDLLVPEAPELGYRWACCPWLSHGCQGSEVRNS